MILNNLHYEIITGDGFVAKKYSSGIMEIQGQGKRYTTQPLGTNLYHEYPIRFTKIISLNVDIVRDINPVTQKYNLNVLIGNALNIEGFHTTDITREIGAYYYTFYKVVGYWK